MDGLPPSNPWMVHPRSGDAVREGSE